MHKLSSMNDNGWPVYWRNFLWHNISITFEDEQDALKEYNAYREELVTGGDIIFKNARDRTLFLLRYS